MPLEPLEDSAAINPLPLKVVTLVLTFALTSGVDGEPSGAWRVGCGTEGGRNHCWGEGRVAAIAGMDRRDRPSPSRVSRNHHCISLLGKKRKFSLILGGARPSDLSTDPSYKIGKKPPLSAIGRVTQ